jgi:cytochrome c-type biogenesis protein CcmH
MNLWLLITMLCSATAVIVSIPLIRRFDSPRLGETQDTAIYQDQLKEVERDLQGGTINAPEAEVAKVEIQRRLAKATKNLIEAKPVSPRWRNFALAATSGLIILGSVSLYNVLGRPDLPSVKTAPTQATADNSAAATPSQVDAMVAKLIARLKANPKDAEGWRMLGWSQFNLQRYPEAVDAYAKAVELDPANIEYKSAYAEALTQGAQGIVTPKARALITEVLAKDPQDARARFYDALSLEQSGDQKAAMGKWLSLYADAPPGAGWREDVKQRITDLAKATGADVSAALVKPNLATAPALTDEQKAQVQALPASDQQEMIKAMVERLAAKMVANPNDLDGWIRLMQAYKVLNEPVKAKDAMTRARAAFSADPLNTEKLKAAATELGIN